MGTADHVRSSRSLDGALSYMVKRFIGITETGYPLDIGQLVASRGTDLNRMLFLTYF